MNIYAGFDLGGSRLRGVLCDRRGEMLGFRESVTGPSAGGIVDAMAEMLENLAAAASVSLKTLRSIGIGSAGSIDKARGRILFAPNIPCLVNYPLVKNLEKRTGARVFLENDAAVALTGVWWKGDGNRFRNWVLVVQGTGLGGGIVIDNRMYTGQSGNAMELGHMSIDVNGRPCRCGRKGCLELYASGTALEEYTAAQLDSGRKSSLVEYRARGTLRAAVIAEMALRKDAVALDAFGEMARYLAEGLTNIVNLFNPEAIFFGGGLSEASRLYLPQVKKIVRRLALPGFREHIEFISVKNQSLVPAMGAAKHAMDSLV
jgi:glucokinase